MFLFQVQFIVQKQAEFANTDKLIQYNNVCVASAIANIRILLDLWSLAKVGV